MFSLDICILFAFLWMRLSRGYWLWQFKVTLWGSELILNYHPSMTNRTPWKAEIHTPSHTVYLSHPPTPTPGRNLSSNRFPKCIKNKGCFTFLQEIEIENDILIYIKMSFADRYWLHSLLVKPYNAWIQLNKTPI